MNTSAPGGRVTPVGEQLTIVFGAGLPIDDEATPEIEKVWTISHVEVALVRSANERRLRALWKERKGNRPTPLLLVMEDARTRPRTLGPRSPDEPVRDIDTEALIRALRDLEGKTRRDATASLAEALERRDRAGIPGVVLRGLLTKHVLTKRLRLYRPDAWRRLEESAEKVRADRDWRENLIALGYRAEELKPRGYLLRYGDRPIAVVHPVSDPGAFSRTTEAGALPEGLLVADCRREGVAWGLLAAANRFRLFPAQTSQGSATGRYLELDIAETENDDHAYLGLLAPESLEPGGLLDELIEESISHGNDLRDTVEQQIREDVLPALARGLGAYLSGPPSSERLESPNVRKLIEDAALLLMFRVLFFLYLESRGFLPLASAAYRPHSATQLLADASAQAPTFDQRATQLWDRFTTLVNAMRTGSSPWGLPAYNGDLFAADAIVGAELLEQASLSDAAFGRALAALFSDPMSDDGRAGVDYGDLEIAHLGRIYEGLLSLRLSFADEDLIFDANAERWMPSREGQESEVATGELFYQTESGGRKAAGVYYTPQVIVRHLVDHAVLPALDAHLAKVAEVAKRNVNDAAAMLFDFTVLDPAMGSAHFLADALDQISDRLATFLADHPLKPISSMLDELRAEANWDGRIEDGDLFRRLVLKRCVYGVDLSDMAVEVAKISLWLASFVPGLSLTYLGHNLRQGDALVGVADPEVLADLGPMFATFDQAPIPTALARAREVAQRIAATPDRTPEEVNASRQAEGELQEVTAGLVRAFDVWCSEPFGVKGARAWLGTGAADKVLTGEPVKQEERFLEPAIQMGRDRSFFHWPAEFPEVFMRRDAEGSGGFDVVIGNPPWEELTIEELAFYAIHDPGLRGITAEAERRRRIQALDERYPHLRPELERRTTELETRRQFFGKAGGYVAQGSGDADTYKLFCERYRALTRIGGWLGVVLPRSAFLVDGARPFRRWLFGGAEVRRLDLLLNAGRWAFDMEPRYTIALLAAQRVVPASSSEIRMTGPSASQREFETTDSSSPVVLTQEHLASWTMLPDGPGFEVPLIPQPEAVKVLDRMRTGPRFDQGYDGEWSAFPVAELHETADKKLFMHHEGVPVWKGRSFDRFNPHGGEPAGFAKEHEALVRLQAKRTSPQSAFKKKFAVEILEDRSTHPYFSARVAFRDISRATDSRTVRACLIPPRTFLTNKAPYLVFPDGGPRQESFVLGVLNSLPFDWQARRFVEITMNFFLLNMLSMPEQGPAGFEAIANRAARLSCVDERFADFAASCGVNHGPIAVEEATQIQAELDALVARAFRLTSEDLEIVFSDFTLAAVSEDYRESVRVAFNERDL